MKWLLLVATAGLLAFGAGCSTSSSQAFEVTSPDGSVISGGNDMMGGGIVAPVFTPQPSVTDMSGTGTVQ